MWKDRWLHRDRPAEGGINPLGKKRMANKTVVLYLCPGGVGWGGSGWVEAVTGLAGLSARLRRWPRPTPAPA